MIQIRAISAAETRPLRHQLLRPHQPPSALVYPHDDEPTTLHAGAFRDDELVGIASVARQACAGAAWPAAWQLRGMATVPAVRGQGYGRALIDACVAHIAAHGGQTLWCNGRTSASEFYLAMGFTRFGEEFVADTGPHYVFWRSVES